MTLTFFSERFDWEVITDQIRQFKCSSIYKQTRGTRPPGLLYITLDLWNLVFQNNIFILQVKSYPQERSQSNFSAMGSPFNISVCINRKSTKMGCCFFLSAHLQGLAVDALTISLGNLYAYIYPPIYPIPKILQYIRQFHCQRIRIAPQWPRRHWYTELIQFWFLHQSKYQFQTTCYITQKHGFITHNLWLSIWMLGCYRQRYQSKRRLRNGTHKITPVNSKV
jgi:hypothetical protein